jgi:hypothetical protein
VADGAHVDVRLGPLESLLRHGGASRRRNVKRET